MTPSATEWSAVVAGAAAVLGTGAGGTITYFVTERQIRSTERLAREDRTQERKMDGYRAIMANAMFTRRHMAWELDSLRSLPVGPEPTPPASGDEVVALASLIMSDEATDVVVELDQINQSFSIAIAVIKTARDEGARQEALADGDGVLATFGERAFRLRKQLRLELNLRPDADPPVAPGRGGR